MDDSGAPMTLLLPRFPPWHRGPCGGGTNFTASGIDTRRSSPLGYGTCQIWVVHAGGEWFLRWGGTTFFTMRIHYAVINNKIFGMRTRWSHRCFGGG